MSFGQTCTYRLNVFPIVLPPLRERTEDIRLLVAHFVRRFAERQGKVIDHVPEMVIEMLRGHAWPGNIRELQNVVERAVIATRSNVLEAPSFETRPNPSSSPARTLAQVEREHILATLSETNWVIGGWKGAAARLGLSRTTLIARLQRLGISRQAQGGRSATAAPRDAERVHSQTGHPLDS